MDCNVIIAESAEKDIFEIFQYILLNDLRQNAEYVAENIYKTAETLAHFPNRGHIPPELARIEVCDYREIHCKPYRIIYRQIQNTVEIHSVLDGRRDVQDLLMHRLLR